ncbi:MAG TPA: transcription termination factor NusA [Candidatus Acidoferrales bacterium]
MASLLYQSIEQLSREKHIAPEIIVSAVEDAVLVASRKFFKGTEELRAKFNKETGNVDVFAVKVVVEEVTSPGKEITLPEARKTDPKAEIGSELSFPKPTEQLGRIAAQTAKQVIFQKVREAERDTIFKEYNNRVGELLHCAVKRNEGPDLIMELGRTEACLPKREQSKLEAYNVGDRVRVVIRAVERMAKGPQVVVSRADPMLVQRLFEVEVPEIYDGTVQIKCLAREAGDRTKIAVMSRDRDVDAVGACVGMKGMRVQSIIRELRGEKIDIIQFNDETAVFAQKALSPAKVSRVQIIDPLGKRLEVIVEDSQLSLAIGKKGQNVRLASKLLGWSIDIKSEEEKRREIEAQMEELTAPGTSLGELPGIGPKTREKLVVAGISTIEQLADAKPEQLLEIAGIGEKMVEKIWVAVRSYFEGVEAEEAAAAAQATSAAAKPEATPPEESVPAAEPPAQPAIADAEAAELEATPVETEAEVAAAATPGASQPGEELPAEAEPSPQAEQPRADTPAETAEANEPAAAAEVAEQERPDR